MLRGGQHHCCQPPLASWTRTRFQPRPARDVVGRKCFWLCKWFSIVLYVGSSISMPPSWHISSPSSSIHSNVSFNTKRISSSPWTGFRLLRPACWSAQLQAFWIMRLGGMCYTCIGYYVKGLTWSLRHAESIFHLSVCVCV